MEAMGIQNLKELLDLGFSLENAVMQAKANDGKIDLADVGLILNVIPMVGPAIQGAGQVVPELKDLSEAESAEIIAYASGKLQLADAALLEKIEKTLKALAATYQAVQAWAK